MTEVTLRFRGQRTHFKKCQRDKWPVLVFNWHLTHQLGKTHIGLYSGLHISPEKKEVYTNRQREVLTQPLTLIRLICPTALTQPTHIHEHTHRNTDPMPRLEPIKQKSTKYHTKFPSPCPAPLSEILLWQCLLAFMVSFKSSICPSDLRSPWRPAKFGEASWHHSLYVVKHLPTGQQWDILVF